MFGFIIVIHVIACIFLVIVVLLLQAGKGGGLADMAGGNQTNSVFGTQTNQFMTRLTEVFAVIFILTSLSLAVMSSQRGKSLVEKHRQDLPTTETVPVADAAKAKLEEEAAADAKAAE